MLKPNNQRGQALRSSSSSISISSGDGSSCGDAGDPIHSPGVGYDGRPSFNVTVSLQPKSPLRTVSQPGVGSRRSMSTATKRSGGSASYESRSMGSASSVVSQTPSLAESIGTFNAETFEAEAKKSVVRKENAGH